MALGFVGCRVTSKVAGIGACERNWEDVKEIKSGKSSKLAGESTEKRAIIYTTAWVQEARLLRAARDDNRMGSVRHNRYGRTDPNPKKAPKRSEAKDIN